MSIQISLQLAPTVSYASYQNNIPLLHQITVRCDDAVLTNVVIAIHCEPAFIEPMQLSFEQLDKVTTITLPDLKMSHDYLAGLNEAVKARLVVIVKQNEVELARQDGELDVLAYDQWAGTRALPELLAAFCMPNHAVIDGLLAQGASLLTVSGRSLSAYQSKNRDDVWAQLSALYNSLCALQLNYSNPPASFGADGQKIRTPERILEGGVATCLDLTMLFAACLEQVGLNPVVLVKKGHAWLACWLVNQSFPCALQDDGQAVRKRVASGELLAFETTALTMRPMISLNEACEMGVQHLQDEREFIFALDIKRARMEQFRPLPNRGQVNVVPDALNNKDPLQIEDAPVLPALDSCGLFEEGDEAPQTPAARLSLWKAKLLDLTLRNRLINFKATKVMLPLLVPDPAHLEDELSDGREWRFKPVPELMQGEDPRAAVLATKRNGQEPLLAAATEAMKSHELMAKVSGKVLDAQLYEIFSATRLGLEEGGANTLYLALGFLRWTEDERAETSYLAPILLVPVTLTRLSVRTGYAIKRHDDETIINPTLLQLLKDKFQLSIKGLDVMPSDDKGVDVAKIWQAFRLAVNDIPRWEVLTDVYLGIFSFTKYLMWKDLQDRTEHLRKNRVVNHLIERPRESIACSENLAERDDMDQRHRPETLLTPMLADSSQLNAVSRGGQGHDFVLEGPPGTGKSQTITNLIAHFLGQGKTVLFVSEKMAALDVVQRRLNAIGLGPFCLQLHSAKAKKAEVLAQLRAPMEVVSQHDAATWQREAERLLALRHTLNDVVSALHREYANGLTVRTATDWAIRYRHWPVALFDWATPEQHSREQLDQLRQQMREIQAVTSRLHNLAKHPLHDLHKTEWSNAWEDDLYRQIQQVQASLAQLQQQLPALSQLLNISLDRATLATWQALHQVLLCLDAASQIPAGFAALSLDENVRSQLQQLRQHGQQRQTFYAKLSQLGCNEHIAQANGEQLAQDWAAATLDWWPKSWLSKRSVTARLAAYCTHQQRPDEQIMAELLEALRGLNREDAALNQRQQQAQQWLASNFQGAATDWGKIAEFESWAQQFVAAVQKLQALCPIDVTRLSQLLGEQRQQLQMIATMSASWQELWQLYQRLQQHAVADHYHGEGWLAYLSSQLQNWQQGRKQLRDWCVWQNLHAQAQQAGLGALLHSLAQGDIAPADIPDYFEYTYQLWWLKQTIDREPVLRNFSSALHEQKISEFQQVDAQFQKLTEQFIVAILADHTSEHLKGSSSELALLKRELAKQKAHIPVRKLIHGIPNLLPKLKPCLLMSPLSVAQYLDAEQANFDVVLFDEASQILVWDAVGAIARGKQVIVVGDPKQLPPTSFFASSDDSNDVDDDDNIKDMESILDECIGVGLPTLRLAWHYRSRHESLITFSNQRYYDAQLVTFPSPITEDRAVSLVRIDGEYDRGNTRTNRVEAEAIVQAVVKHFNDATRSSLTVGIVTFNQTQQRLIETLLDEAMRLSPELEQAIANHGAERLFVKNLENVQGDERDLILFSIAFGKDKTGKLPMNFGPLNKEGGQRRLNVAITRARVGVTIYSSIGPEDIDLSRTRAQGVADLKHYLEFAERGARALVEQAADHRQTHSPTERAIVLALQERGWQVDTHIGCSEYRLDIAVVDPNHPGRYLLGIECDGVSYQTLPTARDRDRLRQQVLTGLGWNLHRVWSNDWWLNPENEIEKLERMLQEQLNATV